MEGFQIRRSADTPDNPGGGLDQSTVDALLDGAGDSAPQTDNDIQDSAPAPADQGGGAVDQTAIDGMLAGDSAGSVSDETSSTSGAVSQEDIDALMEGASGASADATESSSESTDDAGGGDGEDETRLDSLGRPFDEAAAAMQAAIEEEKAAAQAASGGDNSASPPPAPPSPPDTKPLDLPDFDVPTKSGSDTNRVTMLNDVQLRVKIELGRTRMLVEDILELGEGSVVELEKIAGDPVDVYVNDRLIARGEVLVLNDNFCVRISEVMSHDPHRVSA